MVSKNICIFHFIKLSKLILSMITNTAIELKVGRAKNIVPLSTLDLESMDDNNLFLTIKVRKYKSDRDSGENIINQQNFVPQTLWDEDRKICVNAVKKIDFYFQYNPNNGFIDNIRADIIVKDLNMSTETSKAESDNVIAGRHQEFSMFSLPLILLLLGQKVNILENY